MPGVGVSVSGQCLRREKSDRTLRLPEQFHTHRGLVRAYLLSCGQLMVFEQLDEPNDLANASRLSRALQSEADLRLLCYQVILDQVPMCKGFTVPSPL